MVMVEVGRRYTAQMVRELPDDGKRYEVVHGELFVTPAPRTTHQLVLARIYARLRAYLEPLGLEDSVLFSPADISWDEETLVQPDLFVMAPEEIGAEWPGVKTLLLAVEVLSPSSARADRVVKRRLYQEYRVATYWVIDVEAGVVEVWHPDDERPAVVTEQLRWRLRDGAPELTIGLGDLLRPARRP